MVDRESIRGELNKLPKQFYYVINPDDAEYAFWVAQEHSVLWVVLLCLILLGLGVVA
jgi:hypothetical protein